MAINEPPLQQPIGLGPVFGVWAEFFNTIYRILKDGVDTEINVVTAVDFGTQTVTTKKITISGGIVTSVA